MFIYALLFYDRPLSSITTAGLAEEEAKGKGQKKKDLSSKQRLQAALSSLLAFLDLSWRAHEVEIQGVFIAVLLISTIRCRAIYLVKTENQSTYS